MISVETILIPLFIFPEFCIDVALDFINKIWSLQTRPIIYSSLSDNMETMCEGGRLQTRPLFIMEHLSGTMSSQQFCGIRCYNPLFEYQKNSSINY